MVTERGKKHYFYENVYLVFEYIYFLQLNVHFVYLQEQFSEKAFVTFLTMLTAFYST